MKEIRKKIITRMKRRTVCKIKNFFACSLRH